jgi:hypothetical protein
MKLPALCGDIHTTALQQPYLDSRIVSLVATLSFGSKLLSSNPSQWESIQCIRYTWTLKRELLHNPLFRQHTIFPKVLSSSTKTQIRIENLRFFEQHNSELIPELASDLRSADPLMPEELSNQKAPPSLK